MAERHGGYEVGVLMATAGLSLDRVEWHLWNWERWMTFCRLPGQLPNHACVGENYRSYDRDSDGAYDESCRRSAVAVQAVLDGMAPRLRLTVYVKHGISEAVYKLRGDPEENYAEACDLLAVQLSARGLC